MQVKEQAETQLVNVELLKRGNELAYQNLEDRGHHITILADIFACQNHDDALRNEVVMSFENED